MKANVPPKEVKELCPVFGDDLHGELESLMQPTERQVVAEVENFVARSGTAH